MSSNIPKILDNNRGTIVATIVGLVLGQAFAMGLSAYAMRQIFSALHTNIELPITALILLISSLITYLILHIAGLRNSEKLGHDYAIEFRRNLYMHLSRSPESVLAERRVGALSIRFVGDLAALKNWVSRGVTGLVSAIIIIPVALMVMWLLQPAYMLATIIPIIFSLIAMWLLKDRLMPVHRQLRSQRANLAIEMTERAPAAPKLRLLGRSHADFKLLKKRGEKLQSIAMQRVTLLESLKALPEVSTGIATVTILWVTLTSSASAADAAAALAILSIMSRPLQTLATVWDFWCSWYIASEKNTNIFNKPKLKRSRKGNKLPNTAFDVRYNNITIDGLQPFNLQAKAGQIIGVHCPLGTQNAIINILATLEDPKEGNVLFDGMPLQKISLNCLPKALHTLSMNAPIIQGSVRRNLTLIKGKRADDTTLIKLIEKFHLQDMLSRLGGLDARIWEAGRNLSPDEYFRIMMVRASLSHPTLLLVEDPINAICPNTHNALKKLIACDNKTVILVSPNKQFLDICKDVIQVKMDDSYKPVNNHLTLSSMK